MMLRDFHMDEKTKGKVYLGQEEAIGWKKKPENEQENEGDLCKKYMFIMGVV